MRVAVTLKGALAERLPGGRGEVEVPDGAAVEAVLTALGLPQSPCVYVVNGAPRTRGAPLADGDRVVVHPPQAGG